jgi:deazaflavin-dependent oxidoreductase (nitroreductase family)
MQESVRRALARDRTIDITTTGRKTGQPRRKEIWFHNLDGRIYITGTPGKRDWFANMAAHPEFTFHLKETVRADIPARARPIRSQAERRHVLAGILKRLGRESELDTWVKESPLVEVSLELEG